MRRELEQTNLGRDRDRELMSQQIELYKERLERADKDKDQLTALLTQQKDSSSKPRGLLSRLIG